MATQSCEEPREVALESVFRRLNPAELAKAPRSIWACGDTSLLSSGLLVSIVGTREPTAAGRARSARVAKLLVRSGITVISGLARGIDTAAHTTAIERGGTTIAVLGTPLDRYYPPENRALQEEIMRHHLAISMHSPGSRTFKSHFIERNRLMALISDATIIIEAGETSGTISQAWEAIRLGRQLLIPASLADRRHELNWVQQILEYGAEIFSSDNELMDALPPTIETNLAIAL